MDLSAIALQGLNQAQSQLDSAATRIASAGAVSTDGETLDTVDQSAEVVALLSAKNVFSLDLKILKLAGEVQKNLIDVIA